MGLISWMKEAFREKKNLSDSGPIEQEMVPVLPLERPGIVEQGEVCAKKGCSQLVTTENQCRFCGKGFCEEHSKPEMEIPSLPLEPPSPGEESAE